MRKWIELIVIYLPKLKISLIVFINIKSHMFLEFLRIYLGIVVFINLRAFFFKWLLNLPTFRNPTSRVVNVGFKSVGMRDSSENEFPCDDYLRFSV